MFPALLINVTEDSADQVRTTLSANGASGRKSAGLLELALHVEAYMQATGTVLAGRKRGGATTVARLAWSGSRGNNGKTDGELL